MLTISFFSHSVLCIITSEGLAQFWYTLYQQLHLFNLFNLHIWKLKIDSEKAELLLVEECDLLSAPHCIDIFLFFSFKICEFFRGIKLQYKIALRMS